LKEARFEEPRGGAPFSREACARESIATYKNGYSDIKELEKYNRVGLKERPESTLRQ